MPQIRFRDSAGTLRALARCRVRDASGTLRTIQRIRGRDASGTLRVLWSYFTVVLSHTYVSTTGSGASASGVVTSEIVSSVVTGGTGPYTYAWTHISGDTEISATAPTGSSTAFTATCYDGVTYQAMFRLTVTDANGETTTADVSVTLRWVNTT